MDAIESVEKEVERVVSKFSSIKKQSEDTIHEIISVVSECLSSFRKLFLHISIIKCFSKIINT